MKIFIAGGFGYIGGRVAQTLSALGHDLSLGSRRYRPTPEWLPRATTVEMNWNSSSNLEECCVTHDVVIQAAGMNASDSRSNPIAATKFNGEATALLLESAIKTNVKRFVYLSTAHVYSSPLVGSISEDSPTLNTHPYATSHLLGERAVLQMTRKQLIDGLALRITNGFGAPVNINTNCWSLLTCDLCRQVVETGKIRLNSHGTDQRDFIPMTDICNAISYISSYPGTINCDSPLNLSSGKTLTVLDMARLVSERAKMILSIKPQIITPDNLKEDPLIEPLHISPSKFLKRAGVLNHNMNYEIDALLKFCA